MLVVEKVVRVIQAKRQCTGTKGVMNAQQVVELAEPVRLRCPPCPLRALQTAAREQPAPAIGTCICENPKRLAALRRMLAAFEQAKPRIELQADQGRMTERRFFEFEASRATHHQNLPQTQSGLNS